MSKLEELIRELCPYGVEYRRLGEICNFNRGESLVSKNATAGDVPVVSGGKKPAFYHNKANRFGVTITVAGSGAYAGFVSIWEKPIFCCDAFSVDIKNPNEVNIRYLYHYLLNIQNRIYRKKNWCGYTTCAWKRYSKISNSSPTITYTG